MEALNKITTLITEYNDANAALGAALRADGKLVITEFFADIFARHPGLTRAAVRGSTPSFNDGDPCTHSSETFVGHESTYRDSVYADYDDYEQLAEFFTDEGEIENPNRTCTTLLQARTELNNWADIFERVYDTNFIIKAKLLEDGTVEVEVDDYECGY